MRMRVLDKLKMQGNATGFKVRVQKKSSNNNSNKTSYNSSKKWIFFERKVEKTELEWNENRKQKTDLARVGADHQCSFAAASAAAAAVQRAK